MKWFIGFISIFTASVSAQQADIDFERFLGVTSEVFEYRKDRLVDLPGFISMAEEPNTIILDTRSQWAYEDIHISGAKHLSFADFTAEKLAKVIPDKSTQILIYCNNNFFSQRSSLQNKAVEAALNISTFVGLYTYGYKNVYELGSMVPEDDISLSLNVSQRTNRLTNKTSQGDTVSGLEFITLTPSELSAGTE